MIYWLVPEVQSLAVGCMLPSFHTNMRTRLCSCSTLSFMSWLLTLLILTAQGAETRWNGTLSSETFTYFEEAPDPTRTVDTLIWLKPELDVKINKRSRFFLKPILRINPSTEESPEYCFFNPAEMYWDIKLKSLRINLGSNIHNWGNLDGYSPLDIVNGKTLYNPLASDRRGTPMVDIALSGEDIKFQALFIPKQARTLLPSADSRWLPRQFIVNASNENETVLLPSTFQYYYPGYIEFNHALDANFGARLSKTWGALDSHLIYFQGMSNNTQISPTFQADVVAIDPLVLQARSDIGIYPVYFRTETTGVSFVWAPSDIIFKLESAYARTMEKHPTLPDWSWQSGLAVEVPSQIFSLNTTTVFQYYYGENKDPAENLVSSSSRIFDRAALIGQRVEWMDGMDSFVSLLYDYENQGHLIIAKLNYSLSDNWKASGELDFLDGDDDSILGTFKNNDRFVFTLSYLW